MKIIPVAVGVVLLIAAIVLSFVSANNGAKILVKQDIVVMKYVNESDKSLKSGDINGALKYAKLAIQANPQGKKGYICYTNAMVAKYKPAKTQSTTAPVAPTQKKPATQPASDEGSFGC